MTHLTDEQIQDYLQNDYISDSLEIRKHLQGCRVCQKQVDAYKTIFSTLNDDPGFSLPDDLSETIIKAISTDEDKKYKKWESILLLFSVLQGIGLTIYFMDITKFLNLFTTAMQRSLPSLTEQFGWLNGDFFVPILFTGIILIFYGVLDHFIEPFKQRTS